MNVANAGFTSLTGEHFLPVRLAGRRSMPAAGQIALVAHSGG